MKNPFWTQITNEKIRRKYGHPGRLLVVKAERVKLLNHVLKMPKNRLREYSCEVG